MVQYSTTYLSEDKSGNGRQCLDDSDLWNGTIDAGAGAEWALCCAAPVHTSRGR